MSSPFCASSSALGYLYQVRYGLMLLLEEDNDDARLLIESLDDISIETETLDVYQTKFHGANAPNLTNRSPDFWKTIRVWSEQITQKAIDPSETIFNLITTATLSDDSIAFKLRYDTASTRDVQSLITELSNVASSDNPSATNAAGYSAFLALNDEQKKALIKNVRIIDASPGINGAKDKSIRELRYSTTKKEQMYERLEGWFIGEVIRQLLGERPAIGKQELEQKISVLRDSFKLDNLPADFMHSISGDENRLAPYREYIFVRQLEAVGVNGQTINHAISDYHRAFEQTSKWEREGFILPTDRLDYHEKLADDWSLKFGVLCDVDGTETPEELKRKGRRFYETHYVVTHPPIHIRERFAERYVVTGSCQMLSNQRMIGWHPKYTTEIE